MATKTDVSRDIAWLDGKRDEMIARLVEWSAINSGSANLSGLAVMRASLREAFGELGTPVEEAQVDRHSTVSPQGDIVEREVGAALRLIRRPHAPVRVLLAGHMDTVFGPEDPFQRPRVLDADTLNAPGAADMKGGLLVMLYALKAVERSRFAEKVGYEVLINGDEEIGSPGSARLVAEAARRAHFACVYEPALADGTLAGARKGSGNFSAIFTGRAAHAGRDPASGRNAVIAAAQFATRIDALAGARPGLVVNVARIDGGGPNNVVPDRAIVRFNARVEAPADARWLEEEIGSLLTEIDARDGYGARLHGGFNRPPKPMGPAHEKFFQALRAVGEELNLKIAWAPTGGVCDGNNIAAAGIPVIDTLGVRGADIHSANEVAKLDSLEERAKLSALLLLRVAAGDIANPGEKATEAA